MEDHFLEKFKEKTKEDLQNIIDNQEAYQAPAILAARKLLNDWKEELVMPEQEVEPPRETTHSYDFSVSFDIKPFFRGLSYREFLTGFSLALFYHASLELLDWYSNERIFEQSYKVISVVLAFLIFLANHSYYLLEHRRSNNFIGRSMSDFILFFILILTRTIYELILDSSYKISLDGNDIGIFFIVFGLVIMITAFESFVALLKFILKQVKWRIL